VYVSEDFLNHLKSFARFFITLCFFLSFKKFYQVKYIALSYQTERRGFKSGSKALCYACLHKLNTPTVLYVHTLHLFLSLWTIVIIYLFPPKSLDWFWFVCIRTHTHTPPLRFSFIPIIITKLQCISNINTSTLRNNCIHTKIWTMFRKMFRQQIRYI